MSVPPCPDTAYGRHDWTWDEDHAEHHCWRCGAATRDPHALWNPQTIARAVTAVVILLALVIVVGGDLL